MIEFDEKVTSAHTVGVLIFDNQFKKRLNLLDFHNGKQVISIDKIKHEFDIDLKTEFLQTKSDYDTASSIYMLASNAAHHDYEQEQCRLDGLYKDAIQQVSLGGGTVDASYYDNGTSSVNVQVCFAAGEKTHLEGGATKNVEEIEVGDMVMAVSQDDPFGPVYNFEVEGAHTYFIGENDDAVLVHNECGICHGTGKRGITVEHHQVIGVDGVMICFK